MRTKGKKNLPWNTMVFALYKGDTFLAEGTIKEIAKETGKQVKSLKYMTTPTYIKRCGNSNNRLRMHALDDEE